MALTITPIYASVLALFYIYLTFRVIGVRRGQKISLGDGGDEMMQRRMRAHGNFAEYVPITLILMGFAEMSGGGGWLLHGLGALILIGRVLHAYGISVQHFGARRIGMVMTIIALVTAALVNLGLNSLLAALIT